MQAFCWIIDVDWVLYSQTSAIQQPIPPTLRLWRGMLWPKEVLSPYTDYTEVSDNCFVCLTSRRESSCSKNPTHNVLPATEQDKSAIVMFIKKNLKDFQQHPGQVLHYFRVILLHTTNVNKIHIYTSFVFSSYPFPLLSNTPWFHQLELR